MTRYRADLDQLAYELRAERLPYRAIAKSLSGRARWRAGGFFATSGRFASPGNRRIARKPEPLVRSSHLPP